MLSGRNENTRSTNESSCKSTFIGDLLCAAFFNTFFVYYLTEVVPHTEIRQQSLSDFKAY